MKSRHILIGGLLVFGSLVVLHTVNTWRGNRIKKWVFAADRGFDNAPVLDKAGTLLIGSDRTLFALDAATGRSRWQFVFPTPNEYQRPRIVVGPHNTVYTVSEVEGRPYKLYALDGTDGKARWSTKAEAAAPVIGEGDRIFVGGKRMLCLDSRTGKPQWAFQPAPLKGDPGNGNDEGYIEDYGCANGMVFVAFGCPYKRLFALDATTGKPRWSVPLEDQAWGVCGVWSALTVARNNLVLVMEAERLRALDSRTGQLRWQLQARFSPVCLRAIEKGSRIYVATYHGDLYALDEATGAIQWKQSVGETIASPPALDKDGTLYVGTGSNRVYALNERTGETQWSLAFGWLTRSFPYGDSVHVITGPQGMIYAASTDRHLYALKRPQPPRNTR